MSGQHRGVQSIVKKHIPLLIMFIAMLTSSILFFNRLFHKLLVLECSLQISVHSQFFSHSQKRESCLDDCVARKIPRSVQTRLNFHIRIVSTVEQKDDLRKCFHLMNNIRKRDKVSVCEASGLLHWLQHRNCSIYLNFFHQFMPHVDTLYAQVH